MLLHGFCETKAPESDDETHRICPSYFATSSIGRGGPTSYLVLHNVARVVHSSALPYDTAVPLSVLLYERQEKT